MAEKEKERQEVIFEIKRHIGVVASYPTGWNKELNFVSWNNSSPKYDLRDWDEEHQHMSRGITLHLEEIKSLNDMLAKEIKSLKDTLVKETL